MKKISLSHTAVKIASRKDFIRGIFSALASVPVLKGLESWAHAAPAGTLRARAKRPVATACDLAVVKGESPAAITRKAIETLGGIDRFVRKGDTVVIKPNIGWNRAPEYAATTNPEVIATLVALCRAAGARRVKVFDRTCNDAAMCYANSGIADAVRKSGGSIYHVINAKFIPGQFPPGSLMESWPVYRDAVECDCFISAPVAKHHGLSGLTLSMKNLMGVCGGNRGQMHWNIDRKLAELTKFINPDLTIIDAYRILTRNGPSSGRLGDVKTMKTVVAGADPVLADAFAATLFDQQPNDIAHIRKAVEMGVGSADIARSKIMKIQI
ncbi:MAG: DUF362 domain-containing protein [Spirochaetes bacterium]|nr:DUF362 domain-containing protein [Spirochaetota bacterium]